MIRKPVLPAREHSREKSIGKGEIGIRHFKSESDNITCYPVFQNERNILQELHIPLTPD